MQRAVILTCGGIRLTWLTKCLSCVRESEWEGTAWSSQIREPIRRSRHIIKKCFDTNICSGRRPSADASRSPAAVGSLSSLPSHGPLKGAEAEARSRKYALPVPENLWQCRNSCLSACRWVWQLKVCMCREEGKGKLLNTLISIAYKRAFKDALLKKMCSFWC